jgi:hypothetical protein
MLAGVREARRLIEEGRPMVVAGDEALLRDLPRGLWIGGTIPYFMTDKGGVTSRDEVFVELLPSSASRCRIASYDAGALPRIAAHSPPNGYTILILPAFSAVHQEYALNAPWYPELFFRVIAGWVAGVHLDDMSTRAPTVFLGAGSAASTSEAVAIHVELPPAYRAELGIVNIFEQGSGPTIAFPASGFTAGDCLVDGTAQNFHDFAARTNIDSRLPLVADFCGTRINVSIRTMDASSRTVSFYAPVFDGVEYRLARPVTSYSEEFSAGIPIGVKQLAFTCNCVLNFLYGELEGRRTGFMTGPMTFGEIAYQLLNQTMVYVTTTRA